ncbi:MAG: hypothetical protein V3S80_06340 [Sulfurimonadaceae bacterium]|jgi:hypothetical protein
MARPSKKDYCSGFPSIIEGIEINTCCKKHDNEVGQAGTYNPVTPHINFYKCLREQGVGLMWRSIITLGGAVLSLYKYPYFAYKKYKYRQGK